jgi:hypothetical protein
MRRQLWIGAFVVALIASSRGLGAEPRCCKPCQDCFLERIAPSGGWDPYGGGLLHWWHPCCFPCGGAPDDYCRKPLPRVCWPGCAHFYTPGLTEIDYPQSSTPRERNEPHRER